MSKYSLALLEVLLLLAIQAVSLLLLQQVQGWAQRRLQQGFTPQGPPLRQTQLLVFILLAILVGTYGHMLAQGLEPGTWRHILIPPLPFRLVAH